MSNLLLDILVKATLLVAVALAATAVWRRAPLPPVT